MSVKKPAAAPGDQGAAALPAFPLLPVAGYSCCSLWFGSCRSAHSPPAKTESAATLAGKTGACWSPTAFLVVPLSWAGFHWLDLLMDSPAGGRRAICSHTLAGVNVFEAILYSSSQGMVKYTPLSAIVLMLQKCMSVCSLEGHFFSPFIILELPGFSVVCWELKTLWGT